MDKLLEKTTATLTFFQCTELFLRYYINMVFTIIKIRVKDIVPFEYTGKDINKDSLGKLVGTFSKINSNKKLLGYLNNLVKDRNYCAHKAFIIAFFNKDHKRSNSYLQETRKYKEISDRINKCNSLLADECDNLSRYYRKFLKGKGLQNNFPCPMGEAIK